MDLPLVAMEEMEISYPDSWNEYTREGKVALNRMIPPLRIYERDDSNARLTIGPVIHFVPPEESPVTSEKLRDNYGHVLPHLPAEYRQTLLYEAMVYEGEMDGSYSSISEHPDLPVVFADAPIDDDRFADLSWEITIQYMLQAFSPDKEMPRPTTRPTPEVSFQFADRKQAIDALESLLVADGVDFDLPVTISW